MRDWICAGSASPAAVEPGALLVVGRVEVNSPLRNEAAALPVQLVIKAATGAVSR